MQKHTFKHLTIASVSLVSVAIIAVSFTPQPAHGFFSAIASVISSVVSTLTGGGSSGGGSGGSGGPGSPPPPCCGSASLDWETANDHANFLNSEDSSFPSYEQDDGDYVATYNPFTGDYSVSFYSTSSGGGGGGSNPASALSVYLAVQINPDSTWYDNTNDIFITPDDEITLEWDSTNVSSCTNNFGAPDSTSGTFDITPGLTPGEDIVYEVTCTGAGGSVTTDITVETPDIIATTFEANPRIVRSGETTTFEWELELSDSLTLTDADDLTPYSYECTIRGATQDVPHTFDAADNDGSGSVISRTLTSKYTNRLQCDTSTPRETEVEVVPSLMEI